MLLLINREKWIMNFILYLLFSSTVSVLFFVVIRHLTRGAINAYYRYKCDPTARNKEVWLFVLKHQIVLLCLLVPIALLSVRGLASENPPYLITLAGIALIIIIRNIANVDGRITRREEQREKERQMANNTPTQEEGA